MYCFNDRRIVFENIWVFLIFRSKTMKMQISEVERCCVRMNNNLIVDDLKITVNPEMMTSLMEL